MGYIYGKLCEWRWLLPLLVLSCARLRQDCTSGHLRSRLPTHCRGTSVWIAPTAEEDQQAQRFPSLVDQVEYYYILALSTLAACSWKINETDCCFSLCTNSREEMCSVITHYFVFSLARIIYACYGLEVCFWICPSQLNNIVCYVLFKSR